MDVAAVITKENINNVNYRRLTKEAIGEGNERYEAKKERQRLIKTGKRPDLEDEEEEEMEEKRGKESEYDSDFASGSVCPFKLGPFPRKLLSTPIEELDPARQEDRSFVVVGRKFKTSQIFRFTTNDALYCLSPLNPLRRLMIKIYTNEFFDLFVILTIIANCVFLMLDTPRPPEVEEPTYLKIAEYIFTTIYSVEMFVKIFARGFALHPHTYMRDAWNWLDFFVIVLAYITFGLVESGVDIGNFNFLRTFRVLRALKTISVVPGLKSIINALIRSTKMLGEVMLLTVFALCIIALLALQLFMGKLTRKCVANIPPVDFNISDEYFFNFTQDPANWLTWNSDPVICSNMTLGGRDWSLCPENYTCLEGIGDNPNDGYTNFDNIGYSMLTCFQLITLDYWENVYNNILKAQGPYAVFFFLTTVMFGAFYLINLMLAVVSMAYTEEMENQGKEKAKKMKQKKDNVMHLDAKKLQKLAAKKKKKKQKKQAEQDGQEESQQGSQVPMLTNGKENAGYTGEGAAPGTAETNRQDDSISDVGSKISGKPIGAGAVDADQDTEMNDGMTDINDAMTENIDSVSGIGSKNDSDSQAKQSTAGGDDDDEEAIPFNEDDPDNLKNYPCCDYNCCCGCCRRNFICTFPHYRRWRKVQYIASWVVLDPLMDLFITLCILGNTAFLMMDHEEISDSLAYISEEGNKVFTYIFTIECVLKLIALDKKFFKNPWNVFDLFVVCVSLLEFGLANVEGLSVLRSFRLLRVLKLAQSWTTMRTLLSIIASAITAIGNVMIVLLIVMFIFAVIGMQILGGSYTPENFGVATFEEIPPWTFQDFQHSIMLIFRILCGEWIEPLYDCMNVGNKPFCVILFIATLIVGNIMMLNLFLALLLNSFASDSLQNKKAASESKLILAFRKIGRFLKCLVRPCLCCKKYKNKNKIGDSVENLKALANGNGTTKKNGVIPIENGHGGKATIHEFIVVEDVGNNEDKISTIDIDNGSQTVIRHRNQLTTNGYHLHPALASSNGNLPVMYTNGGSYHGSAVSLRSLPNRPHVAFVTPAPVPAILPPPRVTPSLRLDPADARENDSLADDAGNCPLVIRTNAETGEFEPPRSVAATPIAGRSVSHASLHSIASRRDTAVIVQTTATMEEPILEDPVKDCLPRLCASFYAKKCSCIPCCLDANESNWAYRWRRYREIMFTVCEHKVFETFIIVVIFGSSFTLIFEDIYLDLHPRRQEILKILNYVFFGIFVVEMLIKWSGYGFVKYFTSFWCWLDFCIVLVGLLSLLGDVIGLTNFAAFRALRTLRALRPLRAISRWEGMKIVVNAVVHAIPSIANVLLVCAMIWLIFSIMGVLFFKGVFDRCVDEFGDRLLHTIVNNKSECLEKNYSWETPPINFNNVGLGYVALFQVTTFEGWMEAMAAAVDSRGSREENLQPIKDNRFYYYVYFVILIVFGSFFLLNLFIGVIIDNFNALKRKYEGDSSMDMLLSTSQKQYYQTMRRMGVKKPTKQIKQPTAGNKIQNFFYRLTTSNKFELVIVTVIVMNMILMMIDHYGMSQELTDITAKFNIVFTSIFVCEAVLKLIGYSWYYFKIPWNVFDIIVVIFSVLGIVLDDVLNSVFINPTLLRVLRLFRIGRVLRLVKQAKGIRKLLFALVISLPALLNIGILLLLVIFVFSIIGMSQFGHIKLDGALDKTTNFQTWVNSALLLFRLSTSAGWNDVLDPMMIQEPDCDPNFEGLPNGNCGGFYIPIFFSTVYLVITFLVVINTYIAVILENFSQAHAQEEVGITEDDFGMFYQIWEKYDPSASQFIKYEQLSEFCDALELPLRLARPNRIKIAALDMPIYDGFRLHCLDVLFALTKRVLADVEESEDFTELQKQMAEKFAESFPDREQNQPTTTTMKINKMSQAAKIVQRAYRFFRLRREISKAASANRASQASAANSRRNSVTHEPARLNLDVSHGSSLGPAMELPGQLGLSRSATPMIPEENLDNSATHNKAEKYQLEEQGSEIQTIDASVDIVGSQNTNEDSTTQV
ncbi:sodium channel protein type 4 subunit alpha B isoform X3 [Strongylocentrotus purpuratus]|uniref:Sodium channel protein n=1 Tax=Strongylocentrotus purpuratus TaxID=7668 RepID=A0A7M7SV24_STRPU|nr:sodium channel protein type 4 subunit alpha B isoform X3 [Strongylocentrotus purpuratus]